MTWLHHLTGFQLFVITSFYEVSLWQADERWRREHRWTTAGTMISSTVAGIFFQVWWFVHAAWPVIS